MFLPLSVGGLNHIRSKGNRISFDKTYLRHCTISEIGNGNQIIFQGTNYFKRCKFIINGNNNCILFKDKVCGYDATFIIEDNNGQIDVGYKTLFSGKIELACTEGSVIKIGEECLFSSEVDIRNGDSHSIFDLGGNRINNAKEISIGNHVWVGHRAMILKGTIISDNSVIGAGSIVTSRFEEPNVVISGNPARIVKNNITWSHDR